MRWTYVIPRAIIVGLLWGFLTWGLDPLLRYSAVQTVQSMTGARVDIGQLATQIYPPRLQLRQVAVASPSKRGTNLIEFDSLEFRLAGDPLLRRQFVIEEGRLSGVRLHTRRSDDGQLAPSPAAPTSNEPGWLTEKLTTLSDAWLTGLLDDARQQLDPNTLETWRTGTQLYHKWDERLNALADRGRLLKPQYQQLKNQLDNARQGDTLRRIEQYVQVADTADRLTQQAQRLQQELQGIVPEVRGDFVKLDQARRNDQVMIQNKLQLLRPDGRRITESLIGEQMYLQLQQLLSWIDLARDYQQELKEQARPPRGRGRDFSWPILQPTPDLHLQKLLISGSLSIDGTAVPFEALISDITEDAPLLGRPCVVRLKADGARPLLLKLTLDLTRPEPVTQLLATWSDPEGQLLHVGQPDKAMLSARLTEIAWNLNLTVCQEQLQGQVRLQSRFEDAVFSADSAIRPEFVQAASDSLSTIRSVGATLDIGGSLRDPRMQLTSDLGQQVSEGVSLAFANQLQNARERLSREVDNFATAQVTRLKARCGDEYAQLLRENAELLAQIQEVQSMVAAVQSGRMDPNAMFRQAADSKILSDRQQESVGRALQGVDQVLGGRRLPGQVSREMR